MKILVALMLTLGLAFGASAQEKSSTQELTLSEDNTLVLDKAFDGESVVKLMEQATQMDSNLKSGYPIYLFLYTPGGEIQKGLELFEFLAGLNRPVHTVTLFAASMGFQTVQHLGERYIVRYGVLMSHKARGGFTGEFGGGISQLDSRYGLWLRRIQLMDEQTVKRTKGKQTLKSYTAAYTPELWLNGDEAVRDGYADKVVTVKCDQSLSGTYEVEETFLFFKFNLVFSKCPMKTYPLKINVSVATNKGWMKLEKFIEKNGKFGDKCYKEDKSDTTASTKDTYNYYTPRYSQYNKYTDEYEESDKKTQAKDDTPLCVQDKSVTLKAINDKKAERMKWYTRNLRDHIIYSY